MTWSGSELLILNEHGCNDPIELRDIPEDLYKKACVNANDSLEKARKIGFPLMIKASEGGGGKGIRMANNEGEFPSLYNMVCAEAPYSPIFLMKLAVNVRHLEIQLVADLYGSATCLYGRDCSIQRRHQKIIEEAPITVAPDSIIRKMEENAIVLAKAVNYSGVGTVEYLYDPKSNSFIFLELNPRLQVEHPTTEMITDTNLPSIQLQIAMGLPLHLIEDIRKFYQHKPIIFDDFYIYNPIKINEHKDWILEKRKSPIGHVIAARITAENPEAGFKPAGGKITELFLRDNQNAWGYFSIGPHGAIHEYADSQFGHIFAKGCDREQARKNLVFTLKNLSIRGEFRTTVEYLCFLLEKEEYRINNISTEWLDALIKKQFLNENLENSLVIICSSIAYAIEKQEEIHNDSLISLSSLRLPSGISLSEIKSLNHKNTYRIPETSFKNIDESSMLQNIVTKVHFIYEQVQYNATVCRNGKMLYSITMNRGTVNVPIVRLSDGGCLLTLQLSEERHLKNEKTKTETFFLESINAKINKKTVLIYWSRENNGLRLTIDGKTCICYNENDPSLIRSPSSGRIIKYLCKQNQHVQAGAVIAEMESMKMYMPIISNESGNINIIKPAPSTVEAGEIICSLKLDENASAHKSPIFSGHFTKKYLNDNRLDIIHLNPYYSWKTTTTCLRNLFDGYIVDDENLVDEFVRCNNDFSIFITEIAYNINSISTNITDAALTEIQSIFLKYSKNAVTKDIVKNEFIHVLTKHNILPNNFSLTDNIDLITSDEYYPELDKFKSLLLVLAESNTSKVQIFLSELIQKFLKTENPFDEFIFNAESGGGGGSDTLLQKIYSRCEAKTWEDVLMAIMAHSQFGHRSQILLRILEILFVEKREPLKYFFYNFIDPIC